MIEYTPHLPHYPHQGLGFEASAKKVAFALLMDPGTGKTKVTIDTACFLYERGKIRGLLVLAPNEVDSQWVLQELPKHVPPRIPYKAVTWEAGSQRQRRLCVELAKAARSTHLRILAMNHEAVTTKAGYNVAATFLKSAPVLFVIDESHLAIKTPKATRTRRCLQLAPLAFARRILTGTPETQSPFDLYAQFKFLDERILGYANSFVAFKHRYGRFTKEHARFVDKKTKQLRTVEYDQLVEYRNLEELYDRVAKYSFRQRKEDCLDIPPKVYTNVPVHLTPAQSALYDRIKEDAVVMLQKAEAGQSVAPLKHADLDEEELAELLLVSDRRLTMKIKLTMMLRLQQCCGGFVTDDNKHTQPIDPIDKNPRMQRTLQLVENALAAGEKVIVWGQFKAELRALKDLLPDSALMYGATSKPERADIVAKFKDRVSSLRVLVAHPRTAGVGLDFSVAQSMVFYSNSYSYAQRIQAEDRAHRIGQRGTVNVYDLRAINAGVEENIAAALAQHTTMAKVLMTWKTADIKENV